MSMFAEIQQAIEDIAKRHGITDEALPQTLDELKAGTPTIQEEFSAMLEAEAAKKRGGQ